MRLTITALATAALLITGSALTSAQAPSGFEAEPVFKAKDLVAPELLKGPNHTVDGAVPVRGFLYRFTIRSTFGTFEAHGLHMLQIRVREVYALKQLDDMSKTKEFAEAAGKAIVRPVESTANLLIHPVDSIKGLPDGVGRLFDRIKLGGEALASAATGPDKSAGEKAEDFSKRVGSITVTALGYEKERRDLAKGLGVDPYTSNEVLSKKLDDMAWVAFSGRFGIQTAMSVLVPYSMAMSAVTITNTAIYDTPQGDLINQAMANLAATGASDAQVKALMKNPQYTLSVLVALAQGLQRLKGANGLASVVDFAAAAQTQDETRLVAAAVNMLARYSETVTPIAMVAAPGPILGYTAAGALVVPAPVDYVAFTERTARFGQRDDMKSPDRTIWLSGKASPRALKEIMARGWKVNESFSIGAER